MGIFNLFNKSKPSKKKVVTSIETVSYDISSQKYKKNSPHVSFNNTPNHLSKNGLLFHETLLLFYAESYLSGKDIAKFWQYDYNVESVPKLLKSLEKRGFISNGKLTELGKTEISDNEYVLYLHRHKSWRLDADIIGKAIDEYPKKNLWHDVIWSEFNRNLLNEMGKRNFGNYRNIKYSMYQFLYEEKNYLNAFVNLAEVFYIDLNYFPIPDDDPSYAIAPGVIKDFKNLIKKLNYDTEKMEETLLAVFNKLTPLHGNYSNHEIACIIISLVFNENTIAETIFNLHKK